MIHGIPCNFHVLKLQEQKCVAIHKYYGAKLLPVLSYTLPQNDR